MAKKTTDQKKTAPKKAAETKAKTTAQDATENSTQSNDVTKNAPNTAPDNKKDNVPSVFDQALQFVTLAHAQSANIEHARALWDHFGCEAMAPKLATAVLDCAIAQGSKITTILLSKLGIAFEGDEIDHASLEALQEQSDETLVIKFLSWRLRRYAFTGNAPSKMRMWSEHILNLQSFVLSDLQTE